MFFNMVSAGKGGCKYVDSTLFCQKSLLQCFASIPIYWRYFVMHYPKCSIYRNINISILKKNLSFYCICKSICKVFLSLKNNAINIFKMSHLRKSMGNTTLNILMESIIYKVQEIVTILVKVKCILYHVAFISKIQILISKTGSSSMN